MVKAYIIEEVVDTIKRNVGLNERGDRIEGRANIAAKHIKYCVLSAPAFLLTTRTQLTAHCREDLGRCGIDERGVMWCKMQVHTCQVSLHDECLRHHSPSARRVDKAKLTAHVCSKRRQHDENWDQVAR